MSDKPTCDKIPVLWFDSNGCGPDELAIELRDFPSEKDGAIPASLGLRLRAGRIVIGGGRALVDGGFMLYREQVAELHRQLGQWIAETGAALPALGADKADV